MKTIKIKLMLVVLSLASINFLQAQKVINKTFSTKDNLKILTVSGNCTIKKSDNNQINVKLTYTYDDDCFAYNFDEGGDYLSISEKISGNCRGESEWAIAVPENTAVSFITASGDFVIHDTKSGLDAKSASGNMEIENVSGEVSLTTASGDIKIMKCGSDLNIKTASGNVSIESSGAKASVTTASGDIRAKDLKDFSAKVASGNIRLENILGIVKAKAASGDININSLLGEVDISTASGNINATMVEITGESGFRAASGDISVELSKGLTNNLTLSTASGNADLNYNGNAVTGFFEFTAKVDKGEIESPYKFDKEEVIEKNGEQYDKKSFSLGSGSPNVVLNTASGRVRLIK